MKKILLTVMGLLLLNTWSYADIVAKEVEYKAGNTTLKGYLAFDNVNADKRPGVLVVHEWWGNNAYSHKRAEMLAQEGYIALAVDMYGDGKTAEHPDEAGKFSSEVLGNAEIMQSRFLAGLEFLKAQELTDTTRIAAIGYCFGGATVLNMARLGTDLKGVVSFHGSLTTATPAQSGKVKAKILVCHGTKDQFTTSEQVESFKKEMDAAQVDYEFKVYPDAMHGFTNPDATELGTKFNLPIAYNAAADHASWNDMRTFFEKIFK